MLAHAMKCFYIWSSGCQAGWGLAMGTWPQGPVCHCQLSQPSLALKKDTAGWLGKGFFSQKLLKQRVPTVLTRILRVLCPPVLGERHFFGSMKGWTIVWLLFCMTTFGESSAFSGMMQICLPAEVVWKQLLEQREPILLSLPRIPWMFMSSKYRAKLLQAPRATFAPSTRNCRKYFLPSSKTPQICARLHFHSCSVLLYTAWDWKAHQLI